jgi:hypothetical protein
MGWFARHVFPTVIPAKTGIRLPARHMGYGREMGSRIRGNDEERVGSGMSGFELRMRQCRHRFA